MKKFFLIVVMFSFIYCNAQNEEDSINIEQLIGKDYSSYIGKTVEEFLSVKQIDMYLEYVFVDSRPFVLSSVIFTYSEDFFIEIYVDEYEYMNKFDLDRSWKFEDFKKENISRICFTVDNEEVLWVR